ncbi:MAG: hypothetical protein EOO01_08645, partial [Chitinophagaceae bacterium]
MTKSMKGRWLYSWPVILLACCLACKKDLKPDEPTPPGTTEVDTKVSMNNVVGVDQFGRSFSTISGTNDKKQVGLFFWLWIGQPYASGLYDATQILGMPNGLKLLTDVASLNPSISPNGQAHFWGEPLWGYYNSEDVWVMRKQIEMLTIAGVDFIYFDATNSFIYKNVFERLLKIIDEYQQKGWSPPKVVFYTHSKSFQTIREVYRDLYKPGLYSNTWYKVDGKPMIIGYTDPKDDQDEAKSRGDNAYIPGLLSPEILNFFHFKRPQWPSDPVYPDGFPWVEWKFPQPMHNGIMNVTVASHPSVPMSFSLTKGLVNWGRGWNPDTKTNNPQDVDKGTFFQRQWDHAISSNPSMISIGGWNEWIAYKQPYWDEYVLVDAVNKEYSRDIEPMNGGYEDAFFIQMIKNIRRYKGLNTAAQPAKKKTINISAGVSQWNDITSTGVNIHTERMSRNNYSASTNILYTQSAPPNHIRDIKVSHDDKNIYFFIRAKDRFTDNNGKANWLNILIGTGDPATKNWESYEYLVGTSFNNGNVTVGKLNNDFSTTNIGTMRYVQQDNV